MRNMPTHKDQLVGHGEAAHDLYFYLAVYSYQLQCKAKGSWQHGSVLEKNTYYKRDGIHLGQSYPRQALGAGRIASSENVKAYDSGKDLLSKSPLAQWLNFIG